MTDRTMVPRSGLSLVFYLAFAGGAVVAQDAPRTELGARLAESHGDGAFHRLEEVKLRRAVAYPDGTAFGLKTPTAAYHAYLAGLRAVEEEAGVTTLLVNNVLRRTIPGRPEDWPIKPYCDWDIVVLKHYPSWRAWETVERSAAQEAALVHREAAVAAGQVVVAVPRQPPAAPRQVTSDDAADTAIHVVNLIELREEAYYPDGEYPGSSGLDAYGRYRGGGELATLDRELLAGADVPDALNPPDVRWWRLNIVRYPSLHDFMEIELTPEFRDIYRHKAAAMSRICSPATVPTLPESSLGGVI